MITCPRVLCKYRSSTGQVEIMMEGGMTMAGRKPKPTAIKKLEGNPGKRKLNTKEPIPAKGIGRLLLLRISAIQKVSGLEHHSGYCPGRSN